MDWQPIPQQGEWEIVDSLGKDLSAILFCPVRYLEAHYQKPVYQCRCNLVFPRFAVQAAQTSGNWHDIIQRHKEGELNG